MNFTVKDGKVALTGAADTKAVINKLAPLGQAKSTEGVTYTSPTLEIYSSSRIAVITSFSVTRVCTMAFRKKRPERKTSTGLWVLIF